MTNFEAIVNKGPLFLAQLLTECKIRSMERVCEKLGLSFEVSDKMRAEFLMEHHEHLLSESKETADE